MTCQKEVQPLRDVKNNTPNIPKRKELMQIWRA